VLSNPEAAAPVAAAPEAVHAGYATFEANCLR